MRTGILHLLAALAASSCMAIAAELPKPDTDGCIPLFNGKDLTGWNGDPNVWSVKDGAIVGKAESVAHNTFLIYELPFTNFVLKAKMMIVKGNGFAGNSGIQYRSKVLDPKEWIVGGYQADAAPGYWGALYEERGRGVLWKPSPDATKTAKNYDEWNSYEITANGHVVKEILNGVLGGELNDTNETKRADSGVIALQYHAPGKSFEARFKDIRIQILP